MNTDFFYPCHPKSVVEKSSQSAGNLGYCGAMVWLVVAPPKQVEVWCRGEDGPFAEPKTHGPGGPVTSEAVPGFTLDLGVLFPA